MKISKAWTALVVAGSLPLIATAVANAAPVTEPDPITVTNPGPSDPIQPPPGLDRSHFFKLSKPMSAGAVAAKYMGATRSSGSAAVEAAAKVRTNQVVVPAAHQVGLVNCYWPVTVVSDAASRYIFDHIGYPGNYGRMIQANVTDASSLYAQFAECSTDESHFILYDLGDDYDITYEPTYTGQNHDMLRAASQLVWSSDQFDFVYPGGTTDVYALLWAENGLFVRTHVEYSTYTNMLTASSATLGYREKYL